MAPTVIRVMSVAGKSQDSTAALNPRLDAEKSGMVSIFNIQTQHLESVFRSDHLCAETSLRCGGVPLLVRKSSPYIHCMSVGRPRFVRPLPIDHRWPAELRIKDGGGALTIGPVQCTYYV